MAKCHYCGKLRAKLYACHDSIVRPICKGCYDSAPSSMMLGAGKAEKRLTRKRSDGILHGNVKQCREYERGIDCFGPEDEDELPPDLCELFIDAPRSELPYDEEELETLR